MKIVFLFLDLNKWFCIFVIDIFCRDNNVMNYIFIVIDVVFKEIYFKFLVVFGILRYFYKDCYYLFLI